jgi:hypothetical protein
MNHARASFSTEILASATISVVQYLALLQSLIPSHADSCLLFLKTVNTEQQPLSDSPSLVEAILQDVRLPSLCHPLCGCLPTSSILMTQGQRVEAEAVQTAFPGPCIPRDA